MSHAIALKREFVYSWYKVSLIKMNEQLNKQINKFAISRQTMETS